MKLRIVKYGPSTWEVQRLYKIGWSPPWRQEAVYKTLGEAERAVKNLLVPAVVVMTYDTDEPKGN